MITFIYSVEDSSRSRGYNRTITVWRLKHNKPCFVGSSDKINTASTKGDQGEAITIIERETNVKSIAKSHCSTGYYLDEKKYRIYKV